MNGDFGNYLALVVVAINIVRGIITKNKNNFQSNRTKILNTSKGNICRRKIFYQCSVFICGDIELNPGPANPMSLLSARLAQIG